MVRSHVGVAAGGSSENDVLRLVGKKQGDSKGQAGRQQWAALSRGSSREALVKCAARPWLVG